ncbi:MAG: 4-(cytidine 5'-diphospho)-2-C-methyl-D-erythritol kinase [Bacteroidota bacterium]|nr:4-(cytidine 5'-diphospho)-2-C-methyl-D-erythritol kinase [Bacteroidota bacterium]
MICFPNAKINIGLNITEKRSDGFHNIETIFFPIQFTDILEIKSSKEMQYKNSGLIVDNGDADKNIVLKAYYLLKSDFNLPAINVQLHKVIPFGAGLGGGSSDGVFALKIINKIFDLSLSDNDFYKYSKKLGSDCSFFLSNKPCFASGKGDNLIPIDIDLSDYKIVVVNLGVMINTAIAYSKISPIIPNKSLKDLIKLPIPSWRDNIVNDFENIIFNEYPEIKKIKDELYSQGALFALMSGSGSSVFGIFDKDKELNIGFNKYYTWIGK